jgi:hypothetical protein
MKHNPFYRLPSIESATQGQRAGTTLGASPASPLESAQEEMQDAISNLSSTVSALDLRLDMVMFAPPTEHACDSASAKAVSQESRLISIIRNQTANINAIEEHVKSILQRLSL